MKSVFLVVQLLLLTVRVNSRGKGEIIFLSYTDSVKCDGNPCNLYFDPIQILDHNNRVLHTVSKTATTTNSHTVTLDKNIHDSFEYSVVVDIETNKTVTISITVYHDDHPGPGRLIRKITGLVVPFSKYKVGTVWHTIDLKSKDQEATLQIKGKIWGCNFRFTGLGCNFCEKNLYTEQCNKFCKDTVNTTCNGSGDKVCKEHYFPKQKCDTYCKPAAGNYTCNQTTGQKICEEGKTGDDCVKCKEHYFGQNCTIHCVPDIQYHDCSESGDKICLDSTTSVQNNCGKMKQERQNSGQNKKTNAPLIGGACGGAVLLLIILAAIILLKVRNNGDQSATEIQVVSCQKEQNQDREQNQDQEPVYSTVNKEPVYSTLNKQPAHSSDDDKDVYSRLNRDRQENEPYEDPPPPYETIDTRDINQGTEEISHLHI